jgi:NADH-quinone oxidoreductase subunit L
MRDGISLSTVLAFIPLFPLLGAVLAYLNGLKNRDSAGWIATGAAALSFLATVVLFVGKGDSVIEANLYQWFAVRDWSIDFSFRFDNLTAVMCLVVTGIGSLIHLYSIGYMSEEIGRHKFFAYLNLFLFAMLLLVLGANLLVLFVGWEGVGLCSYLLIGFWYKNLAYAAAGRKAFVVNRIGDAGVLLGMFLLLQNFHSLDFVVLQHALEGNPHLAPLCTVIAFALFLGATGKSAQIPLFVWLPDAMAGPTPVSALIHAATMVTAGVYLFARMHFLFDLAPLAGSIVCIIAIATAFLSATIALTQNDIKKVLAYSTVSQLGFMFIAASVGAYWVAVFHVVTHAFFKACLFLGAGSVIHGCHHEQDMRHMGGLRSLMPITFASYLVSTFAIAGIFPFAGYQSKHAILGALGATQNPYLLPYVGYLSAVVMVTAFLTAFYMTRSLVLTFFGQYRGHAHPHESPWKMVVPLIILGLFAVVGGFLEHPLQQYLGTVVGEHGAPHHAHAGFSGQASEVLLGSLGGILGVLLGFVLYTKAKEVPGKLFKIFFPISKLFEGKWFIDELYNSAIIRPLEGVSHILWKGVDQGAIDGTVNGTASVVEVTGEMLRLTQTGQTRHYALYIFLSAVILTVFYLIL